MSELKHCGRCGYPFFKTFEWVQHIDLDICKMRREANAKSRAVISLIFGIAVCAGVYLGTLFK